MDLVVRAAVQRHAHRLADLGVVVHVTVVAAVVHLYAREIVVLAAPVIVAATVKTAVVLIVVQHAIQHVPPSVTARQQLWWL